MLQPDNIPDKLFREHQNNVLKLKAYNWARENRDKVIDEILNEPL